MSNVKWQGVLPYTWQPYYEACRATMAPEFQEHVLFIDNTDPKRNIGCMASHNAGVISMYEADADWLVIMSPAIRFGASGGMGFIRSLEEHPTHTVLEAAGVYGWHLLAFSADCLLKVGWWDENLTPYGFDDIDMSLRIQKAYGFDLREGEQPLRWDKVPVDATDTTMGHSIKMAGVVSPAQPRIDYMVRKWGRHPGASQQDSYPTPFNDPTKPLTWWPRPSDPLSIQNNEFAVPHDE